METWYEINYRYDDNYEGDHYNEVEAIQVFQNPDEAIFIMQSKDPIHALQYYLDTHTDPSISTYRVVKIHPGVYKFTVENILEDAGHTEGSNVESKSE